MCQFIDSGKCYTAILHYDVSIIVCGAAYGSQSMLVQKNYWIQRRWAGIAQSVKRLDTG